jgi:transposase
MPRRYPSEVRRQVIELARSGTKVAQLARVFGMSEASIYNWLKQDRIDCGELDGLSTDQALELAAASRRIHQLEAELAVARKVNEVFLREGIHPRGSSGDRVSDRAGDQRAARLSDPRGV